MSGLPYVYPYQKINEYLMVVLRHIDAIHTCNYCLGEHNQRKHRLWADPCKSVSIIGQQFGHRRLPEYPYLRTLLSQRTMNEIKKFELFFQVLNIYNPPKV